MNSNITFLSFLTGSIPLILLLPVTGVGAMRGRLPAALPFAVLASLVWHLLVAFSHDAFSPSRWLLQLTEILRYTIWIIALTSLLQVTTGRVIAPKVRLVVSSCWVGSWILFLLATLIQPNLITHSRFGIYNNLMLSLLGLLVAEQLFRHSIQLRLPKLISITLGALFAFDACVYSDLLVFSEVNGALWQARGLASGACGLLLLLGSLTLDDFQPRAELSISRPLVFSTSSIMLAGAFLLLMSLGGYYARLVGGNWGSVVQALILFLAFTTVALVFSSRSLRSRLYVQISKHFFRYKYDYRTEWQNLNSRLSDPGSEENYLNIAMNAVTQIFSADTGSIIYLRDGSFFRPAKALRVTQTITRGIAEDDPFISSMAEQSWIFLPAATDPDLARHSHLIPPYLSQIPGLFLILPLRTNNQLIGFIVLAGNPKGEKEVENLASWEDLDLLRMVGHGVANYVAGHLANEKLVESRLFEAHHKFSAFVMHDLKNLIAQQALVVANAGKHLDNREFILDAIGTIDNSVTRMNKLLAKLQRQTLSTSGEAALVSIDAAIAHAVKNCQGLEPRPRSVIMDDTLQIKTDEDTLVMTLTHLIRNAQEATPPDGDVAVSLAKQDNQAVIQVSDTGSGMDPEFVYRNLFAPFKSTKDIKGMGVGAHQCKHFIESMKGTIDVETSPGAGSVFTIRLPLATH